MKTSGVSGQDSKFSNLNTKKMLELGSSVNQLAGGGNINLLKDHVTSQEESMVEPKPKTLREILDGLDNT